MAFLITFMNFLDFMFFPLMIATLVAIVIEQILRRVGNPEWHRDSVMIQRAMGVRKFFYRQAVIINVLWFLGFFVFTFIAGRNPPPDMMGDPNLLWKL